MPVFTTLGANTQALAVNGDGSVVIGGSLSGVGSPFRWTRAGGIATLAFPLSASTCVAGGVSADGASAVGYCDVSPVRWSGLSPSILGLAIGTINGTATAANVDGSILTGALSASDGSTHSGLWTAGATTTLLAEPVGARGSSGAGISGDGSVIVGTVFLSNDTAGLGQAYRWTRATGVMDLVPFIPGTPPISQALGVSADGNKVVFLSKGFGSAVWTASTNTVTVLGGADFTARAISGDGTTVVGYTGGLAIWTGGTPVLLTTTLASLGVSLGDFALSSFSGVSTNGKVVVGTGFSSSTRIQQGWVVVLP